MSREQLETFVSRIQLELEREREERNFFHLERDKIRTFWEITRQQLEENRAYLRLILSYYTRENLNIQTLNNKNNL